MSMPYPIRAPSDGDLAVAARAWTAGRLRWDVPVGTGFWRVLRAPAAAAAAEYAAVRYASPHLSRFSPIERGGALLASAYAGSSLDVALCEVVLRDVRHNGVRRVPTRDVRDRYAVRVETCRPIALIDTRRPRDANLVVAGERPPDLSAAWPQAYAHTRAWAQALAHTVPEMEGLAYESHQVAGYCIVAYRSDANPVFNVLGAAVPVNAGEPRVRLVALAQAAGAVVDFGEVDEA